VAALLTQRSAIPTSFSPAAKGLAWSGARSFFWRRSRRLLPQVEETPRQLKKTGERIVTMSVRDLMPWSRDSGPAPSVYRGDEMDPFLSLRRNVNRLFDEVFRGFGPPASFGGPSAFNGSWPHVEIEENDNEVRVIAEIPGINPDDIEVLLEDGVLTLRGENKTETEDKDRRFSERYYGRFERRLALGRQVDEDHIAATYKDGLLAVTLPKTEKARANVKRITIDRPK
jgi:HSP20 family protein